MTFDTAISAIAALLLVAGPIAVAVTKLTDLVRNLLDANATWPRWVWNVVPMLFGLGIALGWELNLLEAVVAAIPALADQAGSRDMLGQVLTGLIIGAMAGFWHEKLDAWSSWAKAHRPVATPVVVEEVPPTTTRRRS